MPSITPLTSSPVVVAKADPVSIDIVAAGIHASVDLFTVAMAQASNNPLTGAACYSGGRIACVNPPSTNDVYWLEAGIGKIPYGDQPGTDATGTVYLVGHSSGTQTAIFNNLYQLVTGDEIDVVTANGQVKYFVQQVVVLGKSDWSSSEYANQQVPGRLVLGTCYHGSDAQIGGNGSSKQNVVVVAQIGATISSG
jgi:LPXTG-site transpeptidase (sortase) family protein